MAAFGLQWPERRRSPRPALVCGPPAGAL